MTPAEKRIKDLIDRWLASIELHLRYVELSDEAYAEIQAWPKHDRPTRWVLETAKQKVMELKDAFDARHKMGDSRFAEVLELMSFLSNLVGAQHVDRFIPLADPLPESSIPKPMPRPMAAAPVTSDVPKWYAQAHSSQPAPPPAPKSAPTSNAQVQTAIAGKTNPLNTGSFRATTITGASTAPSQSAAVSDATREMPSVRMSSAPPPQPPKADSKKATQKAQTPQPAAKQNAKAAEPVDELHKTVMADAVRLLGWGRTWHELAELIARMADRPPLAEVRKILRTNRPAIEKTAKDAAK